MESAIPHSAKLWQRLAVRIVPTNAEELRLQRLQQPLLLHVAGVLKWEIQTWPAAAAVAAAAAMAHTCSVRRSRQFAHAQHAHQTVAICMVYITA